MNYITCNINVSTDVNVQGNMKINVYQCIKEITIDKIITRNKLARARVAKSIITIITNNMNKKICGEGCAIVNIVDAWQAN